MVATGIAIFRYQKLLDLFIHNYPPNVLANYYGNPLILHTLLKPIYSAQSQVRVSAWERFQKTHASSEDHTTSSHRETKAAAHGVNHNGTVFRGKKIAFPEKLIELNRTQSNLIERLGSMGSEIERNRVKNCVTARLCSLSEPNRT